jgi:hypothetical protein
VSLTILDELPKIAQPYPSFHATDAHDIVQGRVAIEPRAEMYISAGADAAVPKSIGVGLGKLKAALPVPLDPCIVEALIHDIEIDDSLRSRRRLRTPEILSRLSMCCLKEKWHTNRRRLLLMCRGMNRTDRVRAGDATSGVLAAIGISPRQAVQPSLTTFRPVDIADPTLHHIPQTQLPID